MRAVSLKQIHAYKIWAVGGGRVLWFTSLLLPEGLDGQVSCAFYFPLLAYKQQHSSFDGLLSSVTKPATFPVLACEYNCSSKAINADSAAV